MRDGHVASVVHRIRRHIVALHIVSDLHHELFRVGDRDHCIDQIIGDVRVIECHQIPSIHPKVIALQNDPRLDRLVVHRQGRLYDVVNVDRRRRRHPGGPDGHAQAGGRIVNVVLPQGLATRKFVFLNPCEGFTLDLQRPDIRPAGGRNEGHDTRASARLGIAAQELGRCKRPASVFREDQTLPSFAAFGHDRSALTVADEKLGGGEFAPHVVGDLDAVTGRLEAEEADLILRSKCLPAADKRKPATVHLRRVHLPGDRHGRQQERDRARRQGHSQGAIHGAHDTPPKSGRRGRR